MPRYNHFALSLVVLVTLAALLSCVVGSSRAAAPRKCTHPAAFFAGIPTLKPTPIPQPGYARARELLDAAAHEKQGKTDAAWLLEASDGSMALVFAARKCVQVMMPIPPVVPLAMMRLILLGEVPRGSDRGA